MSKTIEMFGFDFVCVDSKTVQSPPLSDSIARGAIVIDEFHNKNCSNHEKFIVRIFRKYREYKPVEIKFNIQISVRAGVRNYSNGIEIPEFVSIDKVNYSEEEANELIKEFGDMLVSKYEQSYGVGILFNKFIEIRNYKEGVELFGRLIPLVQTTENEKHYKERLGNSTLSLTKIDKGGVDEYQVNLESGNDYRFFLTSGSLENVRIELEKKQREFEARKELFDWMGKK